MKKWIKAFKENRPDLIRELVEGPPPVINRIVNWDRRYSWKFFHFIGWLLDEATKLLIICLPGLFAAVIIAIILFALFAN